MKTKKINWFWVAYLLLVAIAIVLLSVSCSTTKSKPAEWRFHKGTVNQHHKIKALKVINCNRE